MEKPHEWENNQNNTDSQNENEPDIYDELQEYDNDVDGEEDGNDVDGEEDDNDVDGEEGNGDSIESSGSESDDSDDEKDGEDCDDETWIEGKCGVFLNNMFVNTIQTLHLIQNSEELRKPVLAFLDKFDTLSDEFRKQLKNRFKDATELDERLQISEDLLKNISKSDLEITGILDELKYYYEYDEEKYNEVYDTLFDNLKYYLEIGILKEITETAKSVGVKLRPPSLQIAKISNITQQGLPEPQHELETTLADVARIATIQLGRLKSIKEYEMGNLLQEMIRSTNQVFTVMKKFNDVGGSCNIMNELMKAWMKMKNEMKRGMKPDKQVLQTNLPHISMLTERFVVVANARQSSTCPYSLKDEGLEDAYSPSLAWDRARRKMRPSTMAALSPIVPIDAILNPVCKLGSVSDHDSQFSGLIWILSMSEQSYYDNTLLTISYKLHRRGPEEMEQLRMLLRHNFVVRDKKFLADHWVNVVKLGEGGFGDVVKVTEKDTGRSLAVKILKRKKDESRYNQMNFILLYLMERNHLVRARNSPFVVQFHESLAMSNPAVLLLVFEVCIGDLDDIIEAMMQRAPSRSLTLAMLWSSTENLLPMTFKALTRKFKFDVSEMMLVYVFEMFCILDYLAQCNIVHMDFKPGNLMISEHFHLKLADFGLVYNLFYVHVDSQLTMINSNKLATVDDLNSDLPHQGTLIYMDIENRAFKIIDKSPNAVDFILTSPNMIVDALLDPDPNFLLDLWAVGISVIECLFNGLYLFELPGEEIIQEFDLHWIENEEIYLMQVTMLDHHYQRFIRNGLINAGGPEMAELMEFLSSIFLPRQLRAQGFLAKKNIRTIVSGLETFMAIDIEKVEAISSFSERGYTHHNIFTLEMNENIGMLFQRKNRKIEQNTFGEYLEAQKSDDQEFLRIQPGYNMAVN